MSLAERKFMKALDDMILNASESELKIIQELDLKTQLDGSNIYDLIAKHDKKSRLASNTPSIKKERN